MFYSSYASYHIKGAKMKMMNSNTYVAIMAGGIGSRFWPGSRESRPKQFLDILGVGKSLIRLTFERFLLLCPKENIFILTNKQYREQVKEHLPELEYSQIICEPSRNNTAPCVAYTAFKLQGLNPNANFVVAPSDHIILKEQAFVDYLKKALEFTANNNALVTLGIQPSRPDTGYGYINYEATSNDGVHKVVKFTEKPNLEKAKTFLKSGDYVWNAGIFIWNVKHILNSFKENAPTIYDLFDGIRGDLNTAKEQAVIDEVYPTSPNISIDYAILEKANNVYTIPSEFGWSDLGTWNSLHAEAPKDENQNVVNSDNILLYNVNNCLVRAPKDKLVLLKDMEDFIVVDEGDVLLVFPKSKEQEIKPLTKEIRKLKGTRYL